MSFLSKEEIKAINRFMANRKKQLSHVPRSFPKYKDGMTTGEYINAFSMANSKSTVNLLPFAFDNWSNDQFQSNF